MAGFMEGKRRSVEVNESDESCQKKLNQAEHRNLHLLSPNVVKNILKIVSFVVALLPLWETTTQVKIFEFISIRKIFIEAGL